MGTSNRWSIGSVSVPDTCHKLLFDYNGECPSSISGNAIELLYSSFYKVFRPSVTNEFFMGDSSHRWKKAYSMSVDSDSMFTTYLKCKATSVVVDSFKLNGSGDTLWWFVGGNKFASAKP